MKKSICSIFLLLTLISSLTAEEHPLIYLVATPRSLSTAFLKMMYYRGDFKTLNEPCATLFFKKNYPHLNPDRLSAYTTSEQAPVQIEKIQRESPLFVKDVVSHFSLVYEACGQDLLKNSNAYYFFLLRDPAEILLSFYNSLGTDQNFKEFFPNFESLSTRLGFKRLYEIMNDVSLSLERQPKLFFAHQLAENPKAILEKFCEYSQIPFCEEFLTWKSGETSFLDFPLMENKEYPPWVEGFFLNVIQSTSFKKIKGCLRDELGEPTFEEIHNLESRSLLKSVYEENKIYYDQFLEAKAFHLLSE